MLHLFGILSNPPAAQILSNTPSNEPPAPIAGTGSINIVYGALEVSGVAAFLVGVLRGAGEPAFVISGTMVLLVGLYGENRQHESNQRLLTSRSGV